MKQIVDLTHEMTNRMPTFDGHPSVDISEHEAFNPGGSVIQSITFGNHTGTHIDAPSHFLVNGKHVNQLPLDHMTGKCYVLDLSDKPKGYVFTIKDISERGISIQEGMRILIRTGWDTHFDSDSYFDSYPCLTLDAAHYLAERKIKLLGLDTPSPGPKGKTGNEIHKILLSAGIIVIESLKNLKAIYKNECNLIALPIALKECSGAPCRVVAILNN